jgi:hypothetical protein
LPESQTRNIEVRSPLPSDVEEIPESLDFLFDIIGSLDRIDHMIQNVEFFFAGPGFGLGRRGLVIEMRRNAVRRPRAPRPPPQNENSESDQDERSQN